MILYLLVDLFDELYDVVVALLGVLVFDKVTAIGQLCNHLQARLLSQLVEVPRTRRVAIQVEGCELEVLESTLVSRLHGVTF